MNRARRLCSLALAAATACFHAQHVASPAEGEGQAATPADSQGDAAQSSTKAREKGAEPTGSKSRVPAGKGRPAVAASPEGLMNPGSVRLIQEALRSKGYLQQVSGELDAATSAALRRFQASEALAATGAPDRETLRRLGVDPSRVYRTAP